MFLLSLPYIVAVREHWSLVRVGGPVRSGDQPLGLLVVSGRDQAQAQYFGRNQIELRDIRLRRRPLPGSFARPPSWLRPSRAFCSLPNLPLR